MISASFAKVLAAGRRQFNRRALEAKRRYPAFDMDGFAQFVQTDVDTLLAAVAAAAPDRMPSAALVAYDIALELTGLMLVGARTRSPLVAHVWRDLAPQFAPLVARHPADALAMLTNAALHLASIAGARPAQWMREMAAIAPLVDSLPALQAVGQVLAWRAGAAHFRQGAIGAADRLPEALALTAFRAGAGQSWPILRERMAADPWLRNEGDVDSAAARDVGAFTGFGGPFAVPPQVRAVADGFVIRSGERHFLLIADACGAVLHSATPEEYEYAGQPSFPRAASFDGATLLVNRQRIEIDLPASQLTACCNGHTVAITSPYTHAIRLLPLR